MSSTVGSKRAKSNTEPRDNISTNSIAADIRPSRSTDTSVNAIHLLRTTQQHHVQLSAMADQKASILMGAAFVVLTILVGQMEAGGLSIPVATLSVFALLSALFAVLAVIPRIHEAKDDPNDSNLLFFGTFTDLSSEEFVQKMERVLRSDQDVHRMMILDIYQMGKILNEKKFKYLTYSYKLFLAGLIVTFVVAVVEYVFPYIRF